MPAATGATATSHTYARCSPGPSVPGATLEPLPDRAARGRLVMAVTDTPDGPVRVVAVCIPWRDAHVRTGRADSRPWGEHVEFCGQLRELRRTLAPREAAGAGRRLQPADSEEASIDAGGRGARPRRRRPGGVERRRHLGRSVDRPHRRQPPPRRGRDPRPGPPPTPTGVNSSDHSGVACDLLPSRRAGHGAGSAR